MSIYICICIKLYYIIYEPEDDVKFSITVIRTLFSNSIKWFFDLSFVAKVFLSHKFAQNHPQPCEIGQNRPIRVG